MYIRADKCVKDNTAIDPLKALSIDYRKILSVDLKVLPVKDLMILRGLASTVKNVNQNLGLFSDLVQEKPIVPKLSRLHEDHLVKMLIEAASDCESTIDPTRKLRLDVDRDSFKVLSEYIVEADKVFLLKAVTNLLDNAVKYSFPKTIVRIYGGLMGKSSRFHITVINRGIKITEEESKIYCKKRGWRSDSAKSVTQQGSGIGLWIVDSIMKAHGGDLIVIPTTSESDTEVKLIMPVKRQIRQDTF